MLHAEGNDFGGLREELARRQARRDARRYRRRLFRRWKRRRLLLKLLALELDLAENGGQATLVRRAEAARLADRLSRNAKRLYR